MDCELDGCSKIATKNLKATYARGKGSIHNLCDKHAIEVKNAFESHDGDEFYDDFSDYTVVVKDLS